MPFLRVTRTGTLPVPLHDGKKAHSLAADGEHIIADTLHNRRRIMFGELALVEELAAYPVEPDAPHAEQEH